MTMLFQRNYHVSMNRAMTHAVAFLLRGAVVKELDVKITITSQALMILLLTSCL